MWWACLKGLVSRGRKKRIYLHKTATEGLLINHFLWKNAFWLETLRKCKFARESLLHETLPPPKGVFKRSLPCCFYFFANNAPLPPLLTYVNTETQAEEKDAFLTRLLPFPIKGYILKGQWSPKREVFVLPSWPIMHLPPLADSHVFFEEFVARLSKSFSLKENREMLTGDHISCRHD